MLLHDSIDRGKTETCSFSYLLCGEEGIENLFEHCRVHPDPRIGDSYHDIPSYLPESVNLYELGVYGNNIRLNGKNSSFRHGIPRVGDEVKEDLVDL